MEVDRNGMANVLNASRPEAKEALIFLRRRGLLASVYGNEIYMIFSRSRPCFSCACVCACACESLVRIDLLHAMLLF